MVLPDSSDDGLRIALAYFGFIHDRLFVRTPGITSVSLHRGSTPDHLTRVLVTTRNDDSTGSYDVEAVVDRPSDESIESTGPGLHDLVVPFSYAGAREGAVIFGVPRDLAIGPEMERHLRLYALTVVSGLRHDLGQHWMSALDRGPTFASDTRETRAGSHLERVGGYSHIIVRALTDPLGLTPEFCDAVFRYAPLHDVGQIVFPSDVLRKPGRLDATEWTLMKSHTTRGRAIVDDLVAQSAPGEWPRVDVLENIVELHHEALDGSGYPCGVRTDDVPIEARIVMVADVFDALTSKRPYKPGWTADEALGEMDRMMEAGKIDGRCLIALVTQAEVVEVVVASGAEPPRDRW
jgi:HD-GYP domain-containing protein (c-di-GMP phosphodiesterase class II)